MNYTVNFATATPFTATLLPGMQSLEYSNGVGPLDFVPFSVDNSGAVDYDASLNGVLSGRGSSTLAVNGVTVQIDAHALTMPNLLMNYTVNFATATAFTATLLPGMQSLFPINGGPVAFSVNNSGAVDYDHSFDSELSGRGTSTLVVGRLTSATVVTSSISPSVYRQSVTFTAAVSFNAPTVVPHTGTVTFMMDGSTPLGVVPLDSSNQATVTTSDLPVGAHTITAIYSGNVVSNGSTSAALTQTVLSAQQELSLIISQVNDMVAQGILDPGTGNALISKLNNAINSLNGGNTIAGDNKMDAFLNQVNALSSKKLDSTDAQMLASEIDLAIDATLANPI
jgi:hypothetical protein